VDLGAAENAGLEPIIGQLAPVVASVSGVLSRADIWTLAGNVAVEMAGGPAMEFEAGRQDVESCEGHGVRLPNAELGQSHIRDVFLNRYGFSERDSAALMGAHVLGRAEPTFSGYTGSWVPQNDRFSNAYFRDLLGRPWRRQVLTSNGKTLTQWNGPGETMMLNTDIELAFDTATCNSAGGNGGRNSCPRATNAFSDAVTEFANGDGGEAAFHAAFAPAFKKLMALGRGNLICALPDCRTPGVQGPGQGQGRPQTRGGEGGRGGRGR
jgi:catalase (peroxidase I)